MPRGPSSLMPAGSWSITSAIPPGSMACASNASTLRVAGSGPDRAWHQLGRNGPLSCWQPRGIGNKARLVWIDQADRLPNSNRPQPTCPGERTNGYALHHWDRVTHRTALHLIGARRQRVVGRENAAGENFKVGNLLRYDRIADLNIASMIGINHANGHEISGGDRDRLRRRRRARSRCSSHLKLLEVLDMPMISGAPQHILVVDDDAEVRALLRRCFELEGYQVVGGQGRRRDAGADAGAPRQPHHAGSQAWRRGRLERWRARSGPPRTCRSS